MYKDIPENEKKEPKMTWQLRIDDARAGTIWKLRQGGVAFRRCRFVRQWGRRLSMAIPYLSYRARHVINA